MKQSEKQKKCYRIMYDFDLGNLFYRDWGNKSKNRIVDKNEYWADDDTLIKNNPRPCTMCGKGRIKGMDPCIINLPNVKFACCGHGVKDEYNTGYVSMNDGVRLEFKEYIKKFKYHFDPELKVYVNTVETKL